MNYSLEKPSAKWKESYLSLIEEFQNNQEKLVPFVLQFPTDDFDAFLQIFSDAEKGIGVKEGFVPHVTYWLIVDDSVLGVSNLRLRLNESLLICGGHIGYGVRPSARKKGYATLMLKETLKKARELGIKRCLLTCDKVNAASAKTILNNGGELDSEEILEESGELIQRYWIII